MAEIDLDLVAKEPVVFHLKGESYTMEDPTMEHYLRHAEVVDALEDAKNKANSYITEDGVSDQHAFDTAMEEFRAISKNFDKKIFEIFVPGLEKAYSKMTPAQKDAVMQAIFPTNVDSDEKKIAEDQQPAGDK